MKSTAFLLSFKPKYAPNRPMYIGTKPAMLKALSRVKFSAAIV